MRALDALLANTFLNRIGHKLAFALAMLLCLAWAAADAARERPPPMALAAAPEWPREWDGVPLRPLALGEVEQRFAQRFPGVMARMTDGERMLVLRQVHRPTRMLHPAADCYRALGWRIEQARLERDREARLWRCFVTRRPGSAGMHVCERIVDAGGGAFTDTSAWYWAAASGQSKGPWQAITVARPL
jgi:hypothetical protein